ncbi:MAG: hypothetical protein ACOC32_02180, partial [Nanoarchaeota archaeon]
VVSRAKERAGDENDTMLIEELKEQLHARDTAISELKTMVGESRERTKQWKQKLDASYSLQGKMVTYQRQNTNLRNENEQLRKQINELKEFLKKKDAVIGDYPKLIEERDQVIKQLNEQLLVLKQEKKVIDEANTKLFAEIDYLQADLKRLDAQISEKDSEVANVRKMLAAEKQLSEQRIRKRLREFAEKETKKELMLNVRIKELTAIIEKQRDVIANINEADLNLYDQFNATISQIKQRRSSIDYSVIDKKLDDVALDIASVSDVMKQEDVDAIVGEPDDSRDASESQTNKELVETIRRSLENGDQPEVIKSSLLNKGYGEDEIKKVIDAQMNALNMNI